jgi:hypothetical protein
MGFHPTNTVATLGVQIGRVGGGTMTAGSADLVVGWTPLPGETSAVGFSAADATNGRIVTVLGAGPAGGILIAHVATYINSGHVTLDVAASASVSGGDANTVIFRPCSGASAKIGIDSIEHEATLSSGETAKFTVYSPDGSFVPVVGQPVLIASTDSAVTDAEGALFGGCLSSVTVSHHPGNSQVDSQCECVSWQSVLAKRVMSDAIYYGKTAGYIAADLCAKMTGDCIGCSSVTGPTLDSITFSALSTYSDALDQLRDMCNSGTDTYYWYVDAWRVVHFALQTTTAAPWGIDNTVTGGAAACLTGVTATSTLEKYCNHGYAQASKELLDPVLEAGSSSYPDLQGDGTKREFSTTQPIELLPQIGVDGGPAQTVGIYNVDTGKQWYYTPGSSQIYQDASQPVVGHSHWVWVRYQYGQQRIEFFQNDDGVNERMAVESGTGYYETVVNVDIAVSKSDAQAIAQSVAERYGVVPQTVKFDTFKPGLKIGQLIALNIPAVRASGNYLISSATMSVEANVPKWTIEAVVGALIGDWRTALAGALNKQPATLSSAGAGNVTPAAPPAPDVAGFTASATTGIVIGGWPYYQFSGTITLPSDVTDLAHLQVVMDGAASPLVVWSSDGPFTASDVISWASVNYPQPTSGPDLVFTPEVRPLNSDLVATVSSHTASDITIHNGTAPGSSTTPVSQPTSVTLTEGGPRVAQLDRSTHTTLTATVKEPTTPAGGYTLGTYMHVQVSRDGTNYGEVGVFPCNRTTTDGAGHYVTTVSIPDMLVFPGAQNYYVRAWCANPTYDPGAGAAVASSAYSLAGVSAPAGNLITALSISPYSSESAPAGFQYNAKRDDDGSQYWVIPSISFDDSAARADANAAFSWVTVTYLDASKTAIWPETLFSWQAISAGSVSTITMGPLMGDYGPSGFEGFPTTNIAYVRLRVGVQSRLTDSPDGWKDSSGASTQQASIDGSTQYPGQAQFSGGPGYVDVLVATGGGLPTGRVDPRRFDTSRLSTNVTINPSGQLDTLNSIGGNLYSNPGFEQGFAGWTGSATWDLDNTHNHTLSGSHSAANQSGQNADIWQIFRALPGQVARLGTWAAGSAGNSAGLGLWAVFYDANGTQIGAAAGGIQVVGLPTTWTYYSIVFPAAPAGTANVKLQVSLYGGSGYSGIGYIDDAAAEILPGTGSGTQINATTGNIEVKVSGPNYVDISGALNTKLSADFVVDGSGNLSQNAVNLAKAYGFDTSVFSGGGGAGAIGIKTTWVAAQQIACSQLIAGDALFAGTATFAYTSTGAYVQVGSAGAVFGDRRGSPTTTVTVNSTGFAVSRVGTSYNVQVTASGVLVNGPSSLLQVDSTGVTITGPSGTFKADSSGVKISNGSSSVTVSPSSVAIANGSFSAVSGSITVNIDSGNYVKVSDSTNLYYSQMTALAHIVSYASGNGYAQLDVAGGTSLGYGELTLYGNSAGNLVKVTPKTVSVAGAGGSATLPANPRGFLTVNINGADRYIPFY